MSLRPCAVQPVVIVLRIVVVLWNLESPDTGSGVEGLPLPSGTPQSALKSQHSVQRKAVRVIGDALLNTDLEVHFPFPVVAMERLTP